MPAKNKPQRGGVVLLGGTGGFVNKGKTDLHKKAERMKFVEELNEQGYIVGYSNAYNRNWGSSKAVSAIRDLYKMMKEHFHVRLPIHVVGISMGSILGLRLAIKKAIPIATLTLIKPVMDLAAHRKYILQLEKEDRIGEELSKAYEMPVKKIDDYLHDWELKTDSFPDIPCQVYCGEKDRLAPLHNNMLPFAKISMESNQPTQLTVVEKAAHKDDYRFFKFKEDMIAFLKQYETAIHR
ncbi:alpha/beta hydrolase [Bacillus tianshenii]|nr:alpha/beta hydrolase [Bacillus tianshenii]